MSVTVEEVESKECAGVKNSSRCCARSANVLHRVADRSCAACAFSFVDGWQDRWQRRGNARAAALVRKGRGHDLICLIQYMSMAAYFRYGKKLQK
eukprot:1533366-Pleurochrysis_carterae.AAC.8